MATDINVEMERFLRYEDKKKQYSVRVSRECEARIELLKRNYQEKLKGTESSEEKEPKGRSKNTSEDEYTVSSSVIVRVLVEEGAKSAVGLLDTNSDNKKNNAVSVDDLHGEIAALRDQVAVMSQLVGKMCSLWDVGLGDDHNSAPSSGKDGDAADEPRSPSQEPNSVDEAD